MGTMKQTPELRVWGGMEVQQNFTYPDAVCSDKVDLADKFFQDYCKTNLP